jgi:TolB-like protein/class 3 adenylate cyclase/predicted Zn-dependent protease
LTSAETKAELHPEIAHVLFMDVVGYTKLLINDQSEVLEKLNRVVREANQFREADAAGKLIRLATGDGMALVFFNNPEAPAKCALEISRVLQNYPHIQLRMGVHSGPINPINDVNDRTNVTGAGINMAQRVMDCGDAGHILLSRRVAEDLEQYRQWRPHLHNLGEYEVKHGVRVNVFNLYTGEVGNPNVPTKLKVAISPPEASARVRRRLIIAVILAITALILGSGFWLIAHRSTPKSTSGPAAATPNPVAAVPEKSIAVLPFENLSKDEENAFFAGGVQDEILSDLAKIADLKVISRTSVMKYKSGPERNLREIAKTLGVSHVVEGSVQRAGGRVRVSAQLIDAHNDAHVWAEHYDRDVSDIFAIQSEIARQIANQLQAKLSPAEKAEIEERPTDDPVAYAYYTKAKEMDMLSNWEGDEKNLNQKVELLEKAIQRDPNFALAYCELAKAQLDLFSEPDRKSFELAKKATETALRLRPDLAEPHLALARYYWFTGPFADSAGAVTYYDRAREELAIVRRKLPNNAEALMIEALIGRHQNRWDASLANLRRASELDPQNGEITYRLQQIYFEMRRYSEFEQLIKKGAASGSLPPGSFNWLALTKLAQGDPVAAQSLMEQVPLEFSPGEWIWNTRFRTALYLRDYEAANRVIAATPVKWADTAFGEQTSSWAEGQVARARGDKQKALAAFAAARKKIEAQFSDKPKDVAYLSELGTLDAGLGRKEDAIREARRAADLLPIAKDSLNGPGLVANLALVYAWTGEPDAALEQLETVATIPNGPTYGDLLLNPCWDSLRGDPRFKKIIASLKPTSL